MRFLLTADTHLRLDEKGILAKDGLPQKLHKDLKLLKNITDYAEKHDIPTIIHGGDICERPNPSEKLRKPIVDWVRYTIDKGIRIILVGGNHDTNDNIYFNLQSDPVLANSKLFRVITDSSLYKINADQHLLFTAWDQNEKIKTFKPQAPTLLFGHLEVIGARYDSEIRSQKELSPKVFKKFKYAFFGHYHLHQKTNTYMYIGATNRHDFGERQNPVGFLDVTWDDELQIDHIEQKGTAFLQFTIDVNNPEKSIDQFIRMSTMKDNFIKIIAKIPRSKSDTYSRAKIEKKVYDAGAWYVTTDTQYIDDLDTEDISKDLSESEIFEEYCERQDLIKDYKEAGLKIMNAELMGEEY